MNKSQLWHEVKNLIESTDFKSKKAKEEFYSRIATLLEPKKGGHSSRIIKEIDGIKYKTCRFTNRLWPTDELVYQNDNAKEEGKDKGYSKVGISLWNKGRKHIKNLEAKLTEAVLEGEDPTEFAQELKEIKEKNLGNSAEWLLQFATDEQLKEIEEKSLPIS
jgi:hypothetical protein